MIVDAQHFQNRQTGQMGKSAAVIAAEEEAARIRANTQDMIQKHMDDYGTKGPTKGAGESSGTYVDASSLQAQALQGEAAAAVQQQQTFRLIGGAVIIGLIAIVLMKGNKKQPAIVSAPASGAA